MTEAGDASAKQILSRSISEDEWDAMIDYLLDEFPSYADMDNDVLEALNKRKTAVMILEKLLKDVDEALLQRPDLLARRWQYDRASKKKKRSRPVVFDRRLTEEQELRTPGPGESMCIRPNVSNANSMQIVTVDYLVQDFQVHVPHSIWTELTRRYVRKIPVMELFSDNVRVYARIADFHQNSTGIVISETISKILDNPSSVLVNYCMDAQPITLIELRFYGSQELFNSEQVVPKHVTDLIEKMPMISRGMTFNVDSYTFRVQHLESNDKSIFVGEMPYQQERDIAFKFTVENIQIECSMCGKEAKHVCSKCHDIPYCSVECQTIDWNHISHRLICNENKRKRDGIRIYGSSAKSNRSNQVTAMRRKLPQRLLAMLDNPSFLHQRVSKMTPQQITEYISQATVGFYGALNDSNYVWYFVYHRFIKPTKLPQNNLLIRYDPRISYKKYMY